MKILVLSNLTSYTYNFRFEILSEFVKSGHEVTIACHNDNQTKQDALESLGCRMIEVPFNGKGTNPKEELKLLLTYRKLVKAERPDIMFSFTIKMNLYGGLAAKRAKVPYVPMITGLGELEKTGKLRSILLFLHKRVMPYAKAVVFQNQANMDFFKENGIACRKAVLVPGSGINLEKFAYCEYPSEAEGLKFAFIGRLTVAKGILEFLEMAEMEKKLSELEEQGEKADQAQIADLKAQLADLETQIKTTEDAKAAEEANIKAATASLEGNRAKMAEYQNEIDKNTAAIAKIKNDIADLNAQISSVISSLDENTLKAIAAELAVAEPEQTESPHDVAKKDEKLEATDVVKLISDALDEIARDIQEEIAQKRIETV